MSFIDEFGIEILLVAYVIGVSLLITELFVPGFIAGVIGAVLLGFALIGIIVKSPALGTGMLVFTIIGGAFFLRFAVRRLTLRQRLTRADGYSSAPDSLPRLRGSEGIAITPLRPSGTAEFNGSRVDVVTLGDMIDKGTRVRVVDVEGNRVVVRAVEAPR